MNVCQLSNSIAVKLIGNNSRPEAQRNFDDSRLDCAVVKRERSGEAQVEKNWAEAHSVPGHFGEMVGQMRESENEMGTEQVDAENEKLQEQVERGIADHTEPRGLAIAPEHICPETDHCKN